MLGNMINTLQWRGDINRRLLKYYQPFVIVREDVTIIVSTRWVKGQDSANNTTHWRTPNEIRNTMPYQGMVFNEMSKAQGNETWAENKNHGFWPVMKVNLVKWKNNGNAYTQNVTKSWSMIHQVAMKKSVRKNWTSSRQRRRHGRGAATNLFISKWRNSDEHLQHALSKGTSMSLDTYKYRRTPQPHKKHN